MTVDRTSFPVTPSPPASRLRKLWASGYLLAVLPVLLATSVKLAGSSLFGSSTTFSLFGLAIIVAGAAGGARPALLASALSTLVCGLFLAAWPGAQGSDARPLFELGLFAAEAVAISCVVAGMRNARARLAISYAQESAARRRLEELAELTTALSNALNRAQVSQLVVERGMQMANADVCTLYELDDRDGALLLIGHRGGSPEVMRRIERIGPESGNPVFRTLKSGTTLWAENEQDYQRIYPALASLRVEGPRAHAFWSVPLVAEGKPIGLLGMGFYRPRAFPAEERAFVATFARNSAEALRRAQLLETEQSARAVAEQLLQQRSREQARAAFVADASRALGESLDYETTLAQVARLAVPRLADFCAVHILGEREPRLQQLAVEYAEPALAVLANELRSRYDNDGEGATVGPLAVLRSGKGQLYAQLDPVSTQWRTSDPEQLHALRRLPLKSSMVVPLFARGRALGTLSFVSTAADRSYDEADLHFAEDLARRCGVAIDNARLYVSEQHARNAADVANRAKDEFLATVSHELRTPLNAIMGWAKLMSMTVLDDAKRKRGVETIERNAVAMAQLIEDLLDVSRIISGKMRLEVQAVTLANVIDTAVESVRPAADARNIHLHVLSERDLVLSGDPARLQQVVWNLLSNAVKFTGNGGMIEVTTQRVDAWAEIRVTDSGKGIDPAFLPYVFDPFRQQDGSTRRARGGLGLGLAITKQLVEVHGGRVEASSEGEGKGATFRVQLPIGGKPAQTPVPPAARRIRVDGNFERPSALQRLRVLVVDDDADAREVVRTVLEECGCLVLTAQSVDEALGLLSTQSPAVLLSDIGMPGADGYDLIKRVRALPVRQGGNIPAAALTAYSRVEDRRRVLGAGYNMHIPKPVEPAELVTVVAALARAVEADTSS